MQIIQRMLCCLLVLAIAPAISAEESPTKLPREYWVATISGDAIGAREPQQKVQAMLGRMQSVAASKPDLICLPELFAQIQITDNSENVKRTADRSQKDIVEPIAAFAREHSCNIVCPVYVVDKDKIYNSALVIDRTGKIIGRYDKIHTTANEMSLGVSPGAADQKLIETDIGRLGIQICYDIEWQDGWENLRKQGAEIIVWPSAFGGGKMVMAKAWENRCTVISSTGSGLSRICDCTGEVSAITSRWNYTALAKVNLERAFLHTWPSVHKFPAIESKYGRKIQITTMAEEEWSILESLSPEVKVQDILAEFALETRDSQLERAQNQQNELRQKP